MSRLKGSILLFVPLCLKFHGRIVGAVSKMATTIYIGAGMLVVSSILLMIVFFGIMHKPDSGIKAEQDIEQSIAAPLQENQLAVMSVSSQAASEVSAKSVDEEPAKDVIATSQLLKGPITLDFGWQPHEVYNDWRYHTGIDIDAAQGQAVEAIYSGEVTDILRDKHSGLTIVVKDNNYTIYYGSLEDIAVVKGAHIRGGQKIAAVGSCDAEPYQHLHIAIKKDEQYIDPKSIIRN